MNNVFDLVGRILISAIFFFEGIDSILYAEKTKLTMAEYHITWRPDFLLYSSIVFLMIGATMLLIGYRIRFGVWLLLIYWLPVTFIVYSFWNDPVSEQRLHAILFMKNIFKKVNWKIFIIFFSVMSLINVVVVPKYIIAEEITWPRIIIGVVGSLIVAYFITLTAKPKEAGK